MDTGQVILVTFSIYQNTYKKTLFSHILSFPYCSITFVVFFLNKLAPRSKYVPFTFCFEIKENNLIFFFAFLVDTLTF